MNARAHQIRQRQMMETLILLVAGMVICGPLAVAYYVIFLAVGK